MRVTTHKHQDQKLQKELNFKLKKWDFDYRIALYSVKGTPRVHSTEVGNSEGKEHLESFKKREIERKGRRNSGTRSVDHP